MMPFASTRGVAGMIPGHLVQEPGCCQHWQTWLGLGQDFKHKIHLKTQDPVYRKQFKIPEAHHQFIEQTLDWPWLKLEVIKSRSLNNLRGIQHSLYNSPIFCDPEKQGIRIVQDFRELNQNSHIDKYAMKEITECIGNIGWADSTIFMTLISHQDSGKCNCMRILRSWQLSPSPAKASSTGSRHLWDYWVVWPVFRNSWKECFEKWTGLHQLLTCLHRHTQEAPRSSGQSFCTPAQKQFQDQPW